MGRRKAGKLIGLEESHGSLYLSPQAKAPGSGRKHALVCVQAAVEGPFRLGKRGEGGSPDGTASRAQGLKKEMPGSRN